MNRKEFIASATPILWLLAGGKVLQMAGPADPEADAEGIVLRFGVASDGHYGEKNTPYENYFSTLVDKVNHFHEQHPFSFFVINGDIVHDESRFFAPAKKKLDGLVPSYYVTQGNHDHIDATGWEAIWGIPVNHHFHIGRQSFLLLTTSNAKGEYLCPDLKWLQQKLDETRHQDNVFIFMHINPAGQTKYAVNCDPVLTLLAGYKNVRAVFNGHDHDMADVKVKNGIPFVFDGHFGGSWGTHYHGFRVVELMKDGSVRSYLMDPVNKIGESTLARTAHS